MATAILNGVVNSQYVNGAEICVFDVDAEKANTLKNSLGVEALASAEEVAEKAQVVVLAVKPQVFPQVLPEIKDALSENGNALVSIGAGKTISYLCSFLESNTPVIRVMPNINAKVG
ncbi:MAG: NAD(P)-binding domain-containing protein, partial [Clostridia bacterium]|nr:NAD(P)-binding domain-containing protein [Clostridia bacterium]